DHVQPDRDRQSRPPRLHQLGRVRGRGVDGLAADRRQHLRQRERDRTVVVRRLRGQRQPRLQRHPRSRQPRELAARDRRRRHAAGVQERPDPLEPRVRRLRLGDRVERLGRRREPGVRAPGLPERLRRARRPAAARPRRGARGRYLAGQLPGRERLVVDRRRHLGRGPATGPPGRRPRPAARPPARQPGTAALRPARGRRPPPPPCRPPPRPRRRRAAPRPRSPRASHPTPPARRTPTAARRAAARRVGGRSAGRALPRRVAPAGEAVEPYPGHRRDWLPARALGRERLLPHHWQSGPPIGYALPMAEEVGERRSGGRQGALLAQYLRIKAEHRRAILLFRLGDFYEMFFEDAETASRDLDLTLTARNRGDPDEVPLCGFPAHAAQPYITRLLARGHTVAVCEQAPARGRGLMEREVVRVITPGTILEEESLEPGAPSLLAALAAEGD